MATIVASRYAVLSVDDEGDLSHKRNRMMNKKQGDVKPQNTTTKKPETNSKKKKKQESVQVPNSKNQNKPNNTGNQSKKKKEPLQKQWEEWKEKDDQIIEGNFEEDLSKAIYLSKLEYEQNKNDEKKFITKKSKKNQKVMSLNEFNNLDSKHIENTSNSNSFKKLENKSEYFNKSENKVQKDTSQEHLYKKNKSEYSNEESLTLVLYETYLENRDREILQLKAEIERLNIQYKSETERLNTQLKNVKTRNSQLCQIIANGEMKDKAEVLMEVERLQTIKDELSEEVCSLHIQLEQERSKVRQLSVDHKSKEKNRKQQAKVSDTQKSQA